jgi:opacity protein-like surface antigen
MYRGRYLTIGAAVKPPTTITRKYQTHVFADSMGQHSDLFLSGQDEITLPWRGTVGFAIVLRENLSLGFEYELRPLASTIYKNGTGTQSNPWLSASLMHVGVEYEPTPWLSLRAGAREQATVFQEIGAPIANQPISFTVYSAGLGATVDAFRFSVAYEYSDMKYQDMWATNVNLNRQITNNVIAGISFELE